MTRTKRDPLFRKRVLAIYDNRCAFCHLKIKLNHNDLSMEAAHIMWKARGGPCTEQNGLSLCPTHHYTFDKGVWSLDPNYKIILSSSLLLDKRSDLFFEPFKGQAITDSILDDNFLPHQKFLKWHGENIFKKKAMNN
ncbi:MAG: hypothetical protein COW00_17840 [Bdellovibrio sp. CG12_big_fil_rev_8_21_14_0_65_39_13]|nr:MAG: hypothetical protein COW78_06330 [Bdellovibrio sp. CG22_combo_CG10-13_8_21_14_all_39_27]PIQ57971.1 MAG: hypothetical protein COW00_17840 [Bdellovibrio sp. CG12_big_fil_rev_8_21_14_0_65_39_13]PIR32895.1 MAG: hypothetical protein COV37_17500 [Bdellovibrio sp. CG11_big_fil_rev_8_21_14_0_20_39_38]